jgi:hypothetical protein
MQTRMGQHIAQHAVLENFQIQKIQQTVPSVLNAMQDHTQKSLQVQVAHFAQMENFQVREGHQYVWAVHLAHILPLLESLHA